MTFFQRVYLKSWIIVLVVAVGMAAWATAERIKRVEHVSALARPALPAETMPADASAGKSGQHHLIIPERNEATLHLLLQTQQMRDRGEWRLRHVDYDNAPMGRSVHSTSAHRWWFECVTWWERLSSRGNASRARERAVLWADPVLQVLMLVLGAALIAGRFGASAAVVFAIGWVTWFPLAGSFIPGVPDARALARALSIGSILLVATALRPSAKRSGWWIAAGVCGGLALWADVRIAAPLVLGIGVGGFAAAWLRRRIPANDPSEVGSVHWRLWSMGGAVAVLLLYLFEYAPSHLGELALETLHPVYGVAWLGLGELLQLASEPGETQRQTKVRRALRLSMAVLGIAALPVAWRWSDFHGYVASDLSAFQLTQQPGAITAETLWQWLSRDGPTLTLTATLAPLAVLLPAIGMLCARSISLSVKTTIVCLLGPIAVALAFATRELSWWMMADATLLLLAVVLVGKSSETSKRLSWGLGGWTLAVAALGFPALGLTQLNGPDFPLTSSEAEELIERDLAEWIAAHSAEPSPIVFAPPRQSLTFAYFAGLRGIGTFAAENRAGFQTTLTLTGIRTMEEVQGLIESRGVRYVVVPSWDPFFDEFAGRYLAASLAGRKSFFVSELRRFNLPNWLRPLSYPMPLVKGFERQSALVFEVVESQSPSLAATRLTQYFLEMGDVARATQTVGALKRFPGDLGALTAQAQVAKARDDAAGFATAIDAIKARLANGADRFLPWEQRVSLAIVLAQSDQIELARRQAARCVADISEGKVRSLSGDSLFGLLVLSDTFQLPLADAALKPLALSLLPPELRQRL